jgi:putative membrane protein
VSGVDGPPGVAPERTRLAWRRTSLSLAVGAVAAGRLLEDEVGAVAWLLSVVALVASAAVMVAAYRRSDDAAAGRAGGRLVTVCAVALTAVGLTALGIVLAAGVAGRG